MQPQSFRGAPILAFLGLMVVGGCATESVQGPETSEFIDANGPAQILLPPCNANSLSGFTIRWPRGNLVIRVNGPTAFKDAIEASLTRWNDALDLAAVIHRPRLSWTSNPAIANVIVNVTPSSSDYCGNESGTTGNSTINMSSGTCGDFGTVLTHEFAHTLGFRAHEFDGQDGVSTNCVFAIAQSGPEIGVLHSSFCQHEIEYIYQAYGQRQGGFSSGAFWDHPIVTGVTTTPFSISVDQAEAVQVTVNQLQFLRGQQSNSPLEGTTFQWSIIPDEIADVNSTGLVTGKLPGQGSVKIAPNNIPATYIRSTQLVVDGHQIPLTVKDTTSLPTGCTPGGALRVTSITVDQEPAITIPGGHSFTAATAGCEGPVFYDWTFDPSLPGWPTTTMLDQGSSVSYSVPSGDYTLTVTSLPHYGIGGGVGFAATRHVNVCTIGGGLSAKAPGSDPGTNVVAGCEGEGGGGPIE